MERLTKRENGHAHYPRCFEEPCGGTGCRAKYCEFETEICERLAAYEDTGLAPEEILKVKRLLEERNYALKSHLDLLKEQLRYDEQDRDIAVLLVGTAEEKFCAGRCEATKEEIGWLERMVRDG